MFDGLLMALEPVCVHVYRPLFNRSEVAKVLLSVLVRPNVHNSYGCKPWCK